MLENKTAETTKMFKTTDQFKWNQKIMKKKSATNAKKLPQESN